MRELKGDLHRLVSSAKIKGEFVTASILVLALARIEELEALLDLSKHGTRRRYKGCRCRTCRAAEATYRSALRLRQASGKATLGATVTAAVEARRIIRSLKAEGFSKSVIARDACGKRDRHLRLPSSGKLTLRRLLELRRFARLKLSIDAAHNHQNA